jgi:hypothetical protein
MVLEFVEESFPAAACNIRAEIGFGVKSNAQVEIARHRNKVRDVDR